MTRGKLIVFEGVDRAGKSTQVRLLGEALRREGLDVRVMRFPDRTTPIGRMIGEYLAGQSDQEDHVIHLLFSANRWEAAASIESSLNSGTTVIIDRYYYSGCVYSAAKSNPSLSLTWARHPEEGLPRPDLAIFLDLSPEEAAKRGGYGGEKYEKVEMQEKVRELFAVLRESKEGEDFVTVDAGAGVDEVSRRVREVVRECMERVDREQAPLRYVGPW
ncbi:thymidylate kinase [Westerdykella ornata]|uniref:Thymidylate kinase n=1 Tax=Westerdykella ornata TaxID=318751 RepID=A0A6A6JTP0_WESOR|nr:thymidylate kinase [Westerdykella ornata]KAF2279990.1 thymidylate kinase [Westerdykella ornata]